MRCIFINPASTSASPCLHASLPLWPPQPSPIMRCTPNSALPKQAEPGDRPSTSASFGPLIRLRWSAKSYILRSRIQPTVSMWPPVWASLSLDPCLLSQPQPRGQVINGGTDESTARSVRPSSISNSSGSTIPQRLTSSQRLRSITASQRLRSKVLRLQFQSHAEIFS